MEVRDHPGAVNGVFQHMGLAAEVAVKYGMFLQTVIDFVLIAFVIFLFLKAYNRMRAPAEAPATPEEVLLLREIRDSLKR